jgi:hypothetical protein
MSAMIALPNETYRITDNIGNAPSLLAIIVGMLNLRFMETIKVGDFTVDEQKQFLYKIEKVGEGIKALQNCSVKPPLTLGYDHITDQMAIIQMPTYVAELFLIARKRPQVQVEYAETSTFLIQHKKHVDDFALRFGIEINFTPNVA